MSACAAKAFSSVSDHAFPEEHPLLKGYRAGAQKAKVVVQPKAKPIFASEIPHLALPKGLPAGRPQT